MNQLDIVIVDYGVGNTFSVTNAIRSLGFQKVRISEDKKEIEQADALILPGVGAFEVCVTHLRKRYLDAVLYEAVLIRKKPILGICVGMQLMATISEENGIHSGLDWIPGKVTKLKQSKNLAIPHVGWNDVYRCREDILFSKTSESPNFYFDHSYHYQCDKKFVTAECDYGIRVAAAISKDNIRGVQFHPEKSQSNGLKLFRGFFNEIS